MGSITVNGEKWEQFSLILGQKEIDLLLKRRRKTYVC